MSQVNPDTYIDPTEHDELIDSAAEATEEIRKLDTAQAEIGDASRKAFNLEAMALVLESLAVDIGDDAKKMMAVVALNEDSLDPTVVVPSYSAEGFVEGAKAIIQTIIRALQRFWQMVVNAVKRFYAYLNDLDRLLSSMIETAKRRTHLVPKGEISLGMDTDLFSAAGKLPFSYTDILNALTRQQPFAKALFRTYTEKLPKVGEDLLKAITDFDLAYPERSLTKACSVMLSAGQNPISNFCIRDINADSRFEVGPTGKVKASEALLGNRSFFHVIWDTNKGETVLVTAEKIRRSKVTFGFTYEQVKTSQEPGKIPAFFAEGVVEMATAMQTLLSHVNYYCKGSIQNEIKHVMDRLKEIERRVSGMSLDSGNRTGPMSFYRSSVDMVATFGEWSTGLQLKYAEYLTLLARGLLRVGTRNLMQGLK